MKTCRIAATSSRFGTGGTSPARPRTTSTRWTGRAATARKTALAFLGGGRRRVGDGRHVDERTPRGHHRRAVSRPVQRRVLAREGRHRGRQRRDPLRTAVQRAGADRGAKRFLAPPHGIDAGSTRHRPRLRDHDPARREAVRGLLRLARPPLRPS